MHQGDYGYVSLCSVGLITSLNWLHLARSVLASLLHLFWACIFCSYLPSGFNSYKGEVVMCVTGLLEEYKACNYIITARRHTLLNATVSCYTMAFNFTIWLLCSSGIAGELH